MTALDTLFAVQDIERLKAQYFLALDEKRWGDFGALLALDCEFLTYRIDGDRAPKPRNGREEIVASVRRTVGSARTFHLGHSPLIEILSGEEATGVWGMTDHIEVDEGETIKTIRGAGRYFERYRKVDGRWLIAKLELRRAWLTID
jgi:hypothetical protein